MNRWTFIQENLRPSPGTYLKGYGYINVRELTKGIDWLHGKLVSLLTSSVDIVNHLTEKLYVRDDEIVKLLIENIQLTCDNARLEKQLEDLQGKPGL